MRKGLDGASGDAAIIGDLLFPIVVGVDPPVELRAVDPRLRKKRAEDAVEATVEVAGCKTNEKP